MGGIRNLKRSAVSEAWAVRLQVSRLGRQTLNQEATATLDRAELLSAYI